MIPLKLFTIALPPDVWGRLPHDRPLAELAKDAEGAARRIRKGSNARQERLRFGQLSSHIETVALELLRQSREWGVANHRGGVPLTGVVCLEHADSTSPAGSVREYADVMERFQIASRRDALGEGGTSPWPTITPMSGLSYFLRTFFSNVHPAWMALFPNTQAREASRRIRLAWNSFRESRRSPEGVESNHECSLLIGRTCHPPGPVVAAKRRLFERLTALNIREMEAFHGLTEQTVHRVTRLLGEKARFYQAAQQKQAAVVEILAAE